MENELLTTMDKGNCVTPKPVFFPSDTVSSSRNQHLHLLWKSIQPAQISTS